MSPKKTTALRLDEDLLAVMRRVKEDVGIPVTTQIEMAVREWLQRRGYGSLQKMAQKTERLRAATRKRS
jgi:hypothetical protein